MRLSYRGEGDSARIAIYRKGYTPTDDGRQRQLVSSPEGWTYSVRQPVVYGSLLQGEVYDVRLTADSAEWHPCEVIATDGHAPATTSTTWDRTW